MLDRAGGRLRVSVMVWARFRITDRVRVQVRVRVRVMIRVRFRVWVKARDRLRSGQG